MGGGGVGWGGGDPLSFWTSQFYHIQCDWDGIFDW
jgi:hypothetical protein